VRQNPYPQVNVPGRCPVQMPQSRTVRAVREKAVRYMPLAAGPLAVVAAVAITLAPTALAARGVMVQIRSGWTNVLARSSVYDAARR
jgi:hypothetical protein